MAFCTNFLSVWHESKKIVYFLIIILNLLQIVKILQGFEFFWNQNPLKSLIIFAFGALKIKNGNTDSGASGRSGITRFSWVLENVYNSPFNF